MLTYDASMQNVLDIIDSLPKDRAEVQDLGHIIRGYLADTFSWKFLIDSINKVHAALGVNPRILEVERANAARLASA